MSAFFKKKPERASDDDAEVSEGESGIGARIGRFFSPDEQKERVLRHEDFSRAGDLYYATVSAAYKALQRVFWTACVIFLIVSILFNYRSITYDNFYYMIKDFSGAFDSDGGKYETLSYESDTRQRFVLYRGGVVSVSPSRLSVFTSTGRRTLNTTVSYSAPYVISSGKYVLVYDAAGTTFSIYNSFARVYTETLDYPITDACMGEDGSFAVVTRSADRRTVVIVYDRDFDRCAELRADYYTFDVALDSDRELLTMLSYEAGDGTGRTMLSVWDLNDMEEEEKLAELFYDGEFPLGGGFLGNSFCVMTDRHIRILDRSFSEKSVSEDYFGATLTAFRLDEQGAAIALGETASGRLLAYDSSGELLYHGQTSLNVIDVCVYGRYLFCQTEDGVSRLNVRRERWERLSGKDGSLLVYNEKTALVCGESKAEYLVFDRD